MRQSIARRLLLTVITAAIPLISFATPAAGTAVPADEPLDLQARFDAVHTHGTMVIYDLGARRTLVYNAARADTAYSPASTFKIFNSLIGLETGAVKDVDTDPLPWDGKVWMHHGKPILPAVCNGAVTLRVALRNSCVPAYQALARRVGAPTYARYLAQAHYGNADVGGPVDRFWLNGHLQITARQQVAFLREVVERKLPLSARTYDALDDILTIEKTPEYTLRAKTGWATSAKVDVGWWVGWVTRGGNTWLFALNLDMTRPELSPARMEIAQEGLRQAGALPARWPAQ